MKLIYLLLLGLIPFQLYSAEPAFEKLPAQVKETLKGAASMVNMDGEPSALVAGVVNAITGDYSDSEVDLEISGAQGFSVARSYTSSDAAASPAKWGPLQVGWHLNHHGKVSLTWTNETENKTYVTHEEGNGVSTYYEGPYKKSMQSLKIAPALLKKGLTNAGSYEISGRTNRKNSRAICKWSAASCAIEMSDGTRRLFSKNPYNKCYYDLSVEEKTNGNQIRYDYDSERRLKRIYSYNHLGEPLSGFKISYPKSMKETPVITIRAEDKRSVRYDFIRKNERFLLSKVSRPNAPCVEYEYSETSPHEFRIVKKQLPEGRFAAVDYYRQGSNRVQGNTIKIVNLADWRLGKVKELRAPVAPNGSSELLYSFTYDRKYVKGAQLLETITTVIDAAGSKVEYHADDHNRLHSIVAFLDGQAYTTDELVWGADDTRNAGQLMSRTFSSRGKILSSCTYLYDKAGNVVEKKADGCTQTFVYDAKNLKIEECNGTSRIFYGYKEGTDLLAHQFLADLSGTIKLRHFYEYDANGVCIVERVEDGSFSTVRRITPRAQYPIGLPEIIEERVGSDEILVKKLINTYDSLGRLLRQDTYDANDHYVRSQEWAYDSMGQVIAETDALSQKKEWRYDANGNKIYEKIGTLETTYTYDTADRLITTTHTLSDGRQTFQKNHYNNLSQKIAEDDIYGNRTHYRYDALGRLIETQYPDHSKMRVTYNALNLPIGIEDASGYILNITYTPYGKPTCISYPDGTEERFEYTPGGLLSRHISQNGTITSSTYDYQNRLIHKSLTTSEGLSKTYTWNYDAFHLLSETDPEGTTEYSYDSFGRVSQVEKNNQTTSFFYDSLGRKSKVVQNDLSECFTYDLLDRIITSHTEDAAGHIVNQTQFTYDSDGNKIAILQDQSLDKFTYDSLGACISHINPLGHETRTLTSYQDTKMITVIAPNGSVQETLFDSLGRVSVVTLKDLFGTSLRKEEHLYDPVGNRICLIENAHIKTEWEYDWFGRVTAKIEASGTPLQKRTSLSYTPGGKKSQLTKPDGTLLSYIHDGFGRLIRLHSSDIDYQYTYDEADRILSVYDQIHQKTTSRSYDSQGNLTSETLANGQTLGYTYDSRRRPTQLTLPDHSTVTYTYDSFYLRSLTRGSHTHTYNAFDSRGRVLADSRGSYTYDLLGRLTSIQTPHFNENITYDSVGNLTSQTINGICSTNRYDSLKQLTAHNDSSYAYDDRYNCIQANGQTRTFNELNQLTSYSYDPNGNLLADKNQTYTYDALDRLIQAGSTHYTYDAFNRRMSKNDDLFLYTGDNEIGQVNSLNQITQFRVLGLGLGAEIGAAVLIELNQATYIPVHDHNGNVVSLSSNQEVQQYRYGPFGECLTPDTLGNPWRFSSKRHDEETNFICYGRRYYIPSQMRWLTPDPIDRAGGPNIYAFLMNNPFTSIDLYGFLGEPNHRSTQGPSTFRRILSASGNFAKSLGKMTSRSIGNMLGGMNRAWARAKTSIASTMRPKDCCRVYRIDGWEGDVGVVYINGMCTSLKDAIQSATQFSQDLGGIRVDLIYNSSYGFIGDLIEVGKHKLGIQTVISSLARSYFAEQLKIKKEICLIGYSEGAAVGKAATGSLSEHDLKRITGISLGGASQYLEDDSGDSHNFVSPRDAVPYIAGFFDIVKQQSKTFHVLESEGFYMVDHARGGTYTKKGHPQIASIVFNKIRNLSL